MIIVWHLDFTLNVKPEWILLGLTYQITVLIAIIWKFRNSCKLATLNTTDTAVVVTTLASL